MFPSSLFVIAICSSILRLGIFVVSDFSLAVLFVLELIGEMLYNRKFIVCVCVCLCLLACSLCLFVCLLIIQSLTLVC
jgi:hypothetical protein